MLRVMQVNRFNCGAVENNGGMLQEKRKAEMQRERESVSVSYVNFQELFPVMVSIVDVGVIVLLCAADKPLEESVLHWILSGGRHTPSVGPNRSQELLLVAVVSPLCLCSNKMIQHVKRRQKQIPTPQCHHTYMLLSAAAGRTHTLCVDAPSGNKTTDRGGVAPPAQLQQDSCVCLSAVHGSIRNFSDSLVSGVFEFHPLNS